MNFSVTIIYHGAGIATGYGLDGRGSIPGRGKRSVSTPQLSDRPWSPPSLLHNAYQGLFPQGGKWLKREADHSLRSSTEVKNG
jgi:hypothetical protein